MAVFFINDCKFNGCAKSFPNLPSLIEHIESVHIDFDPKVAAEFEQQRPPALPLSYVLKYSQCSQRKPTTNLDIRIRLLQHASKAVAEKRSNILENEVDEDEEIASESESSNDSWTPAKGIHIPGRKNGTADLTFKDKPYACSVPGCKKRYKNINGIKYHCKNGHKIFEKSKKMSRVFCKSSKPANFKFSPTTFQDKTSAVESLDVPASANCLPSGNDNVRFKWSTSDSNDNKIAVNEQYEKERKKFTSSPLRSDNNNEFCDADCTSTCINVYTQLAAGGIVNSKDVTIIRSIAHSSNIPY